MTSTEAIEPSSKLIMQISAGYNVDFNFIAKLLKAVTSKNKSSFVKKELSASLGVSDLHAKKLGTIAQSLGLTQKRTNKPTELGLLISKNDSFFDDLGTLWFLHYVISSDSSILFWNRMVNIVLPKTPKITKETAKETFVDLREFRSAYSASEHVDKELKTFFNSYADQKFSRLNYLYKEGDYYILGTGVEVPPLVLAASIARYRDRHRPLDTALPVAELLSSPNSPGVVFNLSEEQLRNGLEALKNEKGFGLENRADLDQVRLTDHTPDYIWLERYYEQR